ncbi:PREDICTED: uncharacterized protein LOC105559526 [Vollenhovia emeryi]|uniref:uncharacterized protein LOC105559526 n=1 Tax=Vollenhovia emeryi TaxID=411798 RepID=UPI0005F584C1|nr:PREDICTED: uncharacterized protein LOC105559526 [Vollenhovia emeryi]
MSAQKPIKKRSKTSSKRFQYQWFDDNPSWRRWVTVIPDDPSKFFCRACKSVLTCGLSEMKRHELRENHIKNMKCLNDGIRTTQVISKISSADTNNLNELEVTRSLLSAEDFNFNDRVKVAEIKLATFFMEKNISFGIASDLILLLKDIGKEFGALQSLSLGRRKLTQIINNVLCRKETDRISAALRKHRFSIYKDEIDLMSHKLFPIMVRYVEPETLITKCDLLQMIYLGTDCSPNKIFESLKSELSKKDISHQSIVGLACDNALVSRTSSLKTKLSETNPNLITLSCVCHTSMLAVEEACHVIPKCCEHFVKGIFTLIKNSKKKLIHRKLSMFVENSSMISKHVETFWLLNFKYIQKILEMWQILSDFLMEQSSKNSHSASDLYKIFQDPATKAYFFFLKFTLDVFNKFNSKFQARNSLIHELQPSSMELLLWFLQKFIIPLLIVPKIFDDTIENLEFSNHVNHLPLEEIHFGFECNTYLKELLDKGICCKTDIDLIRKNCLKFYVKVSEQIRKRLPVNDTFLHNVAVFSSKSALFDCDRVSTFNKVVYVNRRLGGLADEKLIQNEWESLYEINSDKREEWSKLSFDDMWIQISLFSTDEGVPHFPNLRLLLTVVRALPHSNVEVKHIASLMPNAKMKKKTNISIETINSNYVVRYALKDSDKTACTMAVTREHLDLMTSKNIYEYAKFDQKIDLPLPVQDA